jgi:hypothetical protein
MVFDSELQMGQKSFKMILHLNKKLLVGSRPWQESQIKEATLGIVLIFQIHFQAPVVRFGLSNSQATR